MIENNFKKFSEMKKSDLVSFITDKKKSLGKKVAILEHHYQNSDLLPFADVISDSYGLAINSMHETRPDTPYLIFCGANFFPEVASILAPEKNIVQANPGADCPLTKDISVDVISEAYARLKKLCRYDVVPVCYINAHYAVKSFCGEQGGCMCTASNASEVMEYLLKNNKSVFFSPMTNLGINIAKEMQLTKDDYTILDEHTPFDTIADDKKIYIWDAHCTVHKEFSTKDISEMREKYKDITIIAHPECNEDVVIAADLSCFTDGIYKAIKESPTGSYWGVATVDNFVLRLAKEFPDKHIIPMLPIRCEDMVSTELPHLAQSLQSVADHIAGTGELKYELVVPENYRVHAKKAIQMMLNIVKKEELCLG